MTADVLVRRADTAEYDQIGALTVAAFIAAGVEPGSSYAAQLADVAHRAAHGQVLVAVDSSRDAILGAVTFVLPGSSFAEVCRTGEAEFRMLAVDPHLQHLGIGRKLVHACLDRARECGCSAVTISTAEDALAARRLYERAGFRREPGRDWQPRADFSLIVYRIVLAE